MKRKIKLTESQLIDLIERMVVETKKQKPIEKEKCKKTDKKDCKEQEMEESAEVGKTAKVKTAVETTKLTPKSAFKVKAATGKAPAKPGGPDKFKWQKQKESNKVVGKK